MKLFSKSNKKYLVLLPIVFILLNAFLFKHASEVIQSSMMNEKCIEVKNHIKMLAAAANQDRDRPWIKNEKNIVKAMEYLDLRPMMFAGAYKRVDGDWKIINECSKETKFSPFYSEELVDMIAKNESGELRVPFSQKGERPQTWYVYFQYMPMHEPVENRFLAITAISEKSVVSPIPMWLSVGQWGSTVLTFLLNVILVVKLTKKKTTERKIV